MNGPARPGGRWAVALLREEETDATPNRVNHTDHEKHSKQNSHYCFLHFLFTLILYTITRALSIPFCDCSQFVYNCGPGGSAEELVA